MMKGRPRITAIVIVVFSTLLSSFAFYFYQVAHSPNILVQAEARALIIPTGSDYRDVQRIIHKQKIVSNLVAFSFLAKMMKYQENVKPGLYYLQPNMSNREAIRLLRSGEQTAVNVTFNNTRLLEDLAPKITRNLEITEEEFLSYIGKEENQKKLGFDSLTIMSMFVPNTYQAYWNISVEDLLGRMRKEYDKFWTQERKAKAQAIGLSPVEVSILASIVQAETANSTELRRVAGLYINRLNSSIPLQADPTLIFAARDFTVKRVLNKHLEIESPYNTYKYTGLPPGPINIPERRALDAVLNYERHKYLYMCAKEDFSENHNFAASLAEHNKNADKYRRALNEARVFR